jgi:hypothetical protein
MSSLSLSAPSLHALPFRPSMPPRMTPLRCIF